MQIKIRKYRPRLRLTEYTSLFEVTRAAVRLRLTEIRIHTATHRVACTSLHRPAPGSRRARRPGENRAGTTEGHEQSKFYFQSNHGARVRTGFYFSYSDKLQD